MSSMLKSFFGVEERRKVSAEDTVQAEDVPMLQNMETLPLAQAELKLKQMGISPDILKSFYGTGEK